MSGGEKCECGHSRQMHQTILGSCSHMSTCACHNHGGGCGCQFFRPAVEGKL